MVRSIPRGKRSYMPDYIAFLAMLTVAAAVAVGLTLQIGLTLPVSSIIACSGLAAAITGHVLLRRNDSVARLEAELAQRSSDPRFDDIAADAAGDGGLDDEPEPVPPLGDYRPAGTGPALTAPAAIAADQPLEDEALEGESLARLQIAGPKTQPVSGSKAHLGTRQGDDVGKIIKRLADDIGAGRRTREGVAIDRVLSPKPITAADFELAQGNTQGSAQESAQANAHANVQASAPEGSPAPSPTKWDVPPGISMPANGPSVANAGPSEAAAAHPAVPEPVQSVPPSAEAEDAADKLAAVANALAGESVDVFLEPIHGLDDRLPRHYEVTIRLALADGEILDDEAYTAAARGTGLLPLIDAVKVSHTKRVGLQLLRRGQSGALISSINGESVSGSEFSDDLATIMGPDKVMAGRLVLSFAQQDVRAFTPAQWASLERLATIGFRFAISDITDMDIDFDMLARRGFAFAKLDAEVFRAGLQASVTVIPPSDICRHIAGAGLTLVVNRLDTERDVAEVLGFGALFGQGMLFGGPRPVKADVIREQPMVQGPPAAAPR